MEMQIFVIVILFLLNLAILRAVFSVRTIVDQMRTQSNLLKILCRKMGVAEQDIEEAIDYGHGLKPKK